MDPVTNPVVLSTDNPFGPCVRIISQGAAQERETEPLIEPSGISNSWVLRRSTRSASSNTAYEIEEESHQPPPGRHQSKRHYMACRKRTVPLYEDRKHDLKQPHHFRRKPGSRMTTETVPVSEAPFSRTPTCSREQRERTIPSASTDIIPASLLLSMAKSIDLKMDWFGREPCIMDVILDSRDLARYSTDALIAGVGDCVQDLRPRYRTYNCRDQTSLDTYWSTQAAILMGSIYVNERVGNMGFPESVERSTATWPSVLNCEG
ncbi:hypothetical protein CVT25_015551 [Psilocybe cyanescens]|uniref:Uncharacterized protein n=1 Tax=Psilocybe cyanescens TaxID=93625 RepID=A0A409WIA1_PSICY|nr:hypothetical protein CVT25_015551 [Psilocybe cyanescens]